MAFLPTNASQVQQFAVALYGIKVGTTTMAAVQNDITLNGGLNKALNSYYAASFGSVTTAAVAASVAANLGLTGTAATDAAAYITAALNAAPASARGEVISGVLNLFATLTSNATFGAAATTWNAKVASAVSYAGAADAVVAAGAEFSGVPFTMTTGLDAGASFVGTAGNDTYSGPLDSWTALDHIDGGAGTDSLTVATTGTAAPAGVTVANIETLNISTTGAGYAINTTTYTGLTSATVTDATAGAVSVTAASTTAVSAQATGNGTVDVIGSGGVLAITAGTGNVTVGGTAVANALTAATVTGGTVVAITDKSGASAATGSTLKTVTISGAAGDQTLTGNGITTVNLTKLAGATTVGDTTVTAAAGTRELTVNYNGVDIATTAGAEANGTDVLTLTDAEATSLKINAVTAASFDTGVSAAKATSVAIDAAVALHMQALTAGVAKTVAISGAAKTTIVTDTLASDVVITSTSAGGVTLTQALTADQQYVGTASSGVDTISLGATTKAITTGAGNDVITSAGTVGTGGSVDAGEGTDVIVMTSAQAEAADNSSTFNSKFKNFETLQISDALAATADINVMGINGANKVVLKAGGGHASTAIIRDLANNGTVQFDASAAGGLTVVVKDALFNAADTLNVGLNAAGIATIASFTAAGAETLNISAPDATAAGGAAVKHVFTALTAADATSINVTGNNGLTITAATGSTKVTSFDASAVAGNGAADTAANLAVTYASLNTTATAAVSIKGGAGDDVLSGNAGIDTIVGNAGIDNITGGANQDVLTGGAGADRFHYGLKATTTGAAGVNVDKITDFVAGTDKIVIDASTVAGAQLLGVTFDLTDATATMAAAVADATTVASISDVYTALAAYTGLTASAADGSAVVAQVYTFANGAAAGTYLVINDSTAGFQAANDIVINITGLSGTLAATDIIYA
jgi:S-layer protein